MRIGTINALSQVYSAQKPSQINKSYTSGKMDQVQISSFGKDIQTLKQALAAAPDVRTDVTQPVKAAINNGTYSVSDDDFASKLLAKYEEKLSF